MTQLDLGFGDVGFTDHDLTRRYAQLGAVTSPKAQVLLTNHVEPNEDDLMQMSVMAAWKLEQRVLIVGDRPVVREKIMEAVEQLGIPPAELRIADDRLGVVVEQARD